MILESLVYGGQDALTALARGLYRFPASAGKPIVRLYPTGLQNIISQADGEKEIEQGWKTSFPNSAPASNSGAFSSGCWAWAMVSGPNYGGIPFDSIRFRVLEGADGSRKAVGLDVPVLGLNMTRKA